MMLYDFIKQGLVERRKIHWEDLRKIMVCLYLLFVALQFLSFHIASVRSQSSSLLVFAEASSFARLDNIDPSGWFYQAVLYNPTDSDIVVTGLRWWYNASVKLMDASRDARCYDKRCFSFLPDTYNPNDRTISWGYAAGNISLTVPAKKIIVTWIEVPTYSKNDDTILATYYVEAFVDGEWLSSPLYASHSGHDNAASTVFRADFDLTTDPNDEQQTHPNPEWLFNEDRSVVAGLSTRVRLIPVISSRNSLGIKYATVNVTFPSGWSYVPSSAYNPYGETITPYSVDSKDRLKWDLDSDVLRYSTNQSMAQNYIEFNITAPYVPGIHNFTVTSITTSLNARTTTENQYIYAVVETPPNATFTSSPTTLLTGENVNFNATASYDLDGQIVNYFWDFGDGNTGTGNITTHSYADNGTYTVALTVTDNDGLKDTALDTIIVQNRPPVAQFTESAEIVDTDVVIYFNASDSYDLDGFIVSYFWDFGDDTNATGVIVNHTYAEYGAYTVTLTVTDDDGATTSTNATKTILNRSPVAIFTESAETVYTDEVIYFNAPDSYDLDGTIVSYFWNFGDGTNATGIIVEHAYAENGTYSVTLTVTDDDGATDSTSATKTILNKSPVASFTESATTLYTEETVYFNASNSYDPDGYIVNYFWDFGDGTNATGITVSHAYVEDGNYTVKLTVTDDDGTSAITTDIKMVLNRDPVASFVIVPQQPIAGEIIIFNASDSYDLDGSILTYTWNFGDGNITTATSPTVTHSYETFGNYLVILNVTDNDDSYNSSTLTLTVHNVDIAIVDMVVSVGEVYIGQTVNLTIIVRNEGTIHVTFNVIISANDTIIGTRTVQDLQPNETRNLNFGWNTSSLTKSGTYVVRAEIGEIQGETDVTDNVNESVYVKMYLRPFNVWDKLNSYTIPISIGFILLLLSVIVGTILIKRNKHVATPKTLPSQELGIFDALAGEDIPDAYSVMIVGDAGSGKSVLCQQLVNTYLKQGRPCIYVSYDCFPNEIRENMRALGWNTSGYEQNESFLFIDCYSSIAGVVSQEKHSVKQPFALSELGIAISAAIEDLKQKSIRIFLDSTVALFTRLDPAKVVEFLQDRSAQIKGENGVFFFTIGKGTIEHGLTRRLEEIVDCIIELEVHEEKGETKRKMRIKKLRGRKYINEWIPFKIEQKKGFVLSIPKKWIREKK